MLSKGERRQLEEIRDQVSAARERLEAARATRVESQIRESQEREKVNALVARRNQLVRKILYGPDPPTRTALAPLVGLGRPAIISIAKVPPEE